MVVEVAIIDLRYVTDNALRAWVVLACATRECRPENPKMARAYRDMLPTRQSPGYVPLRRGGRSP